MKFKRLMALMLALVVFAAFAIGCSKPADEAGKTNEEEKVAEETNDDDDEAKEEPQEAEEAEEDEGPVQEGGTLTVSIWKAPEAFGVFSNAMDYGSGNVCPNVFNKLVKMNLGYEIVPDLAETYEYKDDGKTIVFHLRDNVKWHDGTDFTADDVKFTFDTLKAGQFYISGLFANITAVNVIDKNTVELKLNAASGATLAYLASNDAFIMPKHIYQGSNVTQNSANKAPIGTGPFKFLEQTGETITLEKNTEYFGEGPYLDKLIFKVYSDVDKQYQDWINNELDIAGVPRDKYDELAKDDKYKFISRLDANKKGIIFNTKNENFSNTKLREAMLYGIDRDEIFKNAYKEVGNKSDYFIPSVYKWALNDDAKFPERDVEKAKKLIEEAGYTMNSDGYYLEATVDAMDFPEYEDLCSALTEQFKEIGIKLNFSKLEYPDYNDKVITKRDFELAIVDMFLSPDISTIGDIFSSDGYWNYGSYSNEEVDKELALAKTLYKDEDRAPHYKKVQELLRKDVPIIFFWEMGGKYPAKKYIKGTPLDKAHDNVAPSEYTLTWIDESKK